jgi:hypothetical protein
MCVCASLRTYLSTETDICQTIRRGFTAPAPSRWITPRPLCLGQKFWANTPSQKLGEAKRKNALKSDCLKFKVMSIVVLVAAARLQFSFVFNLYKFNISAGAAWSSHLPEEQKIRVRLPPGCEVFRKAYIGGNAVVSWLMLVCMIYIEKLSPKIVCMIYIERNRISGFDSCQGVRFFRKAYKGGNAVVSWLMLVCMIYVEKLSIVYFFLMNIIQCHLNK